MRIGLSRKQRISIGFGVVLLILAPAAAALHQHWLLAHSSISALLALPLLLLAMHIESQGTPDDTVRNDPANLPNLMVLAEELRSSVEQLDERNRQLQTQNQELLRQLNDLRTNYEQQRSISITLQESFLPRLRSSSRGYDIAHKFLAARSDQRIGGDFYDVFELADGALGLLIGDVSGNGVGATMHAAMAKYMLMAIASQETDPAKVVTQLNKVITGSVHDDMFITLFYGVLYTEDGRLVYTNAGHESPILLKGTTGECVSLETTGHPVGIFSRCRYGRREMKLGEGDALLLCTDGITEARRDKEFFGPEGLQASAQELRDRLAGEMVEGILAKVDEFIGGRVRERLSDDAALVVIKAPQGLTRI